MSRPDFTSLSQTLLCGGIAARHVKRYLRELGDHFDDLVREAVAGGKSLPDAERVAAARIGSVHQLAQTMLARDDLKSWGARYPWAVYGLGPLGSMMGCLLFLVVMMAAIRSLDFAPLQPATEQVVFDFITGIYSYVLPPVLAATFVVMGVQERRDMAWILIGAATLCILGALFVTDVEIFPTIIDGRRGILRFGMGVSPPEANPIAIVAKLVVNFAAVAAVFSAMTRSQRVSIP